MGLRRPRLLSSSDGSEVLRNGGNEEGKRANEANRMNFKNLKQWAKSCVPPEKSNLVGKPSFWSFVKEENV